uniref:Uncharacterized protein n=1 Tax=viral metagenome TaxID=1070528 RepID=A0A6H2A3R3_9ZZZZ
MKTNPTNWTKFREIGMIGCKRIAPRVIELRTKMRYWDILFNIFQAMVIEADRHIVPITKVPASASISQSKQESKRLAEKFKALTPDEKRDLVKALEGML